MRIFIKTCALAWPLGLAACAPTFDYGQTADPFNPGATGPVYPQPDDAVAEFNQFNTLLASEGYTIPPNFPASASYDGVATLQRPGGQYYGILDLTAVFADGTFTGRLDDFNALDQTAPSEPAQDVDGSFTMSGTLTGLNGVLSNALNGTATGVLDGTGDTLSVTGNFAGTSAAGVDLLLVGNVYQGFAQGN